METKQKRDFLTREIWIKAVVDDEGKTNATLREKGEAFLSAQMNYRSGNGDVIGGLMYLDDLEEEFRKEYNR